MSLANGTRLGPYEVVSPIGAGGMGEVYRARDSKLKREVALKVLPADVARDRERLARFQREAEVLASLNHPHIAHIHGLEESSGTIALVMELVEGEDLSTRIARYESNESGAYEVYVRPFPDVNAGRWQISNGGGRKAMWHHNGRELFFVSATGAIMAVPIEKGTVFSAGAPVQLFRGDYYFGSASSIGRTYDVSPDGQRFLMIKEDRTRPTSLSVVVNWTETLKRLVPAEKQP